MPRRLCYLCGAELAGRGTKDHVPPLMFFGRRLRTEQKLQLMTLRVHAACNRAFQEDEEYFVHSFCWFGKDTTGGRAVIQDVLAARAKAEKAGLRAKVHDEWEPRPSGLWLPSGRVVKRFDGRRVGRVVWKIVRGLHFAKYREVLADRAPRSIRLITDQDERPKPDEMELMAAKPEGRYPGVFDFKHRVHMIDESRWLYEWGLLFWDCMASIVRVRKGELLPLSST
jgi:hypothetical protein